MLGLSVVARGERIVDCTRRHRLVARWSIGLLLLEGAALVLLALFVVVIRPAQVNVAREGIQHVRSGALFYRARHPKAACPTIDALHRSGSLDQTWPALDPWGRRLYIECVDYDIIVRSDGPDGVPGTADDIER